MISDNITNFVFVQPMVGCKVKTVDNRLNLFPTCSMTRRAYECLVAVVKRCFRKTYGNQLFNYVQLTTALAEVVNVVNSRHLTYVLEEMLSPLTPNHFLRLRTINTTCPLHVSTGRLLSKKKEFGSGVEVSIESR